MSRKTQFAGSLRAIYGLARMTTKELMRTGAAPISFLLYLIFLSAYQSGDSLEIGAASARFLDHGLGGLAVITMFLAMFFGMQLAGRKQNMAHSSFVLRRTVGPASFFWGRLIGLTLILLLFGLIAGALVVLHHTVRFGAEEKNFTLESRTESPDFSSQRQVKFMRKKGQTVKLSFDVDSSRLPTYQGEKLIMGRFAPQLVLLAEGGETRSPARVRLTLKDADSPWQKRRYLNMHEGRAQRFEFRLPKRVSPARVIATLENRSSSFLVKFRQGDFSIVAGMRSHAAGVMRGALVLSLLAAILASFALFFREQMSFGPSLVAAFGMMVLTVSMEVLEFGVLAEVSQNIREFVVSTVSTVLPDAGEYDVIQRLERGRDVGWDVAGELLTRFSIGALLIGILSGWISERRSLA